MEKYQNSNRIHQRSQSNGKKIEVKRINKSIYYAVNVTVLCFWAFEQPKNPCVYLHRLPICIYNLSHPYRERIKKKLLGFLSADSKHKKNVILFFTGETTKRERKQKKSKERNKQKEQIFTTVQPNTKHIIIRIGRKCWLLIV